MWRVSNFIFVDVKSPWIVVSKSVWRVSNWELVLILTSNALAVLVRLLPALSLILTEEIDIEPEAILTFKLLLPSKVNPSKSVWIVSNFVFVDVNVVSVAYPEIWLDILTFKLLLPSKVKPSKSVWIVSNFVFVDTRSPWIVDDKSVWIVFKIVPLTFAFNAPLVLLNELP